ncbi:colicin E3/pyocin S6 family cytotoxin [Pseudomonas sp. RP23018S]|uniref:colicin E3/pyocin S6 family cytotoxin n=1 Tax=Pseudomonas sp. RP23018S TaxID=3096037 RepID=UPI002ACAEBA2|nr:colicin E3/pyocin S6 family cytotoxin [Pseudomonas sp. RP23018S]MDZ5602964.1 colicin E3/pyocin S6 family cytotoxin [Pseudomonas sp. RP23018S]
MQVIGGDPLPAALGALTLTGLGVSSESAALRIGAGLVASNVVGVLALLWPSSLGDSALYSDEQLRSLETARTRVRLQVELQPDGTLKGYGFNTQTRRDWEQVPVVQFKLQGEQQVADFGNGVTLIWTPAVDTSRASAIPPLQGAPDTPAIWIFPPTEQADRVIVNPIYPPEYRDFILVFPADAGIRPLYVVLSTNADGDYFPSPATLPAFPLAVRAKAKAYVQGGGKKRMRWKDKRGKIYEWDSQHGAVEIYDKQGNHLGEFDHETGVQLKPAVPGRTTPK